MLWFMCQYCSDSVCCDQHNAVKNKQVNRKNTHIDILSQNAADGRGSRDSHIGGGHLRSDHRLGNRIMTLSNLKSELRR